MNPILFAMLCDPWLWWRLQPGRPSHAAREADA